MAAVSQAALDDGRRNVFLFTDLANPTSNHIYQAIGYEPVRDLDEWSLVSVDHGLVARAGQDRERRIARKARVGGRALAQAEDRPTAGRHVRECRHDPHSPGAGDRRSHARRRLSSCHGEVAERLMAALLKSADSKEFVGSNPTLSANGDAPAWPVAAAGAA